MLADPEGPVTSSLSEGPLLLPVHECHLIHPLEGLPSVVVFFNLEQFSSFSFVFHNINIFEEPKLLPPSHLLLKNYLIIFTRGL